MLCAWVVLSAGMCARRRSHFLLLRQKKVTKEKAAPLAVSLRFAVGSLRCSRAGRRCRTRFVRFALAAQTAAASQSTQARMLRCAPAPRPALLGTARRGFEFLTRAIAALGPGLISAAASRGSICSLSLWERVGVRASQFKNRSCSRLPHMRCRCISLESIVRRRRAGACTHAFARVLAKPLTTARPAPRWPAQRVRPA